MQNKYSCYIGFAVRKGSVVYGLDSLQVYRKKVFLLLCSDALADNSLSKATAEATRRGIDMLIVPQLEQILQRNTKVLAICDKSLAQAIKTNYIGDCPEVINDNN